MKKNIFLGLRLVSIIGLLISAFTTHFWIALVFMVALFIFNYYYREEK